MTQKEPFDILFIDNHLIIVNKPAGILTQPTNEDANSLETHLKTWIKAKYKKPGNAFLGVVHRLDRQVSGVMVFARTSKALLRLNAAIRSKQFEKTYIALTEGVWQKESGELEDFVCHSDYHALISTADDAKSKIAKLHYKIIAHFENATLFQIQLETGRYHQIRVQFGSRNHPIVGDKKYGSKLFMKEGRIALHHYRLKLTHPVTKAALCIEAPLPDFLNTLSEGV